MTVRPSAIAVLAELIEARAGRSPVEPPGFAARPVSRAQPTAGRHPRAMDCRRTPPRLPPDGTPPPPRSSAAAGRAPRGPLPWPAARRRRPRPASALRALAARCSRPPHQPHQPPRAWPGSRPAAVSARARGRVAKPAWLGSACQTTCNRAAPRQPGAHGRMVAAWAGRGVWASPAAAAVRTTGSAAPSAQPPAAPKPPPLLRGPRPIS